MFKGLKEVWRKKKMEDELDIDYTLDAEMEAVKRMEEKIHQLGIKAKVSYDMSASYAAQGIQTGYGSGTTLTASDTTALRITAGRNQAQLEALARMYAESTALQEQRAKHERMRKMLKEIAENAKAAQIQGEKEDG